MSLEMDKCTEQFTMRIAEILKIDLDKLTKIQKSRLIESLILCMAKAVHDSRFDPENYLTSNNNDYQ